MPKIAIKLQCLYTILAISVILFLASFPFLKWGFSGLINNADANFPIHSIDLLGKTLYAWDDSGIYFGVFNFLCTAQSPFYALPAFFSAMGLSLDIVNRLTFITLFALVGFSMYFAMKTLMPKSHLISYLLPAIFYMYNPYLLGVLWLGDWIYLFSFASLPILLAAFIKGLQAEDKTRGEMIKWCSLVGLSSFFVLTRLRLVGIVFVVLILYLLLFLLKHRAKGILTRSLKFLLISGVFSALISSVWILPLMVNAGSVFESIRPIYNAGVIARYPPTFSDILNVFRQVGYGIPTWVNYGAFFDTAFATVLGIFIVFYAYFALIKIRSTLTFFFGGICAFLTLHMILFVKLPVYQTFYVHLASIIPYPLNSLLFSIDLAYLPLIVIFCYAFLIGQTTHRLVTKVLNLNTGKIVPSRRSLVLFIGSRAIKNPGKKLLVLLLSIILSSALVLNNLPLIITSEDDPLRPNSIPAYYEESRKWLDTQNKDFRVYAVPPPMGLTFDQYTWSAPGAYSTSIVPQFVPVPVAMLRQGSGFAYSQILEVANNAQSMESLTKLLQMMGVKYILVRNDTIMLPSSLYAQLDFEKEFGNISLYNISSYCPPIYAATNGYVILGNVSAILSLLQFQEIDSTSAFFFVDNIKESSALDLVNLTKRLIVPVDFAKSNPQELAALSDERIDCEMAYLIGPSVERSFEWLKSGLYWVLAMSNFSSTSKSSFLEWKNSSGDLSGLSSADLLASSNMVKFYGLTNENDTVEFAYSDVLANESYNWTMDVSNPGFHGLIFSVNSTELNFDELMSEGGGITMQIYGNNDGGELRFTFNAPNSEYFQYPLQTVYMNWTGWKEITLPLSAFESVGNPNWTQVVGSFIWHELPSNLTAPATLQIRGLTRYLGPVTSLLIPTSSANVTNEMFFHSNSSVDLSYTKIDPTKYVVTANSTEPFFLILNQAYDYEWKAFVNDEELPHFLVNSYANAYYIEGNCTENGIVPIDVVFVPQKYLAIGTYLSFFAVVTTLLYLSTFLLPIKKLLLIISRVSKK